MGLRSLAALTFAAFLAAPPARAETVFLIAGGYVSCRTAWNVPTDAPVFQAALPRLGPKSYVAVCFRSESRSLSFQTDLDAGQTTGNVEQLTDAVRERMAAAEPGSRLVIIGHSYGGWAVLKVAEALAGEIDIAYLATIDPVSTIGCPPSAYLSTTQPHEGCTVAPRDLASGFMKIRDAGISWVQFYQDRYHHLRSTPIAEATRNLYLDYPALSDLWAWRAHALMDSDVRVWDVLMQDIAQVTDP